MSARCRPTQRKKVSCSWSAGPRATRRGRVPSLNPKSLLRRSRLGCRKGSLVPRESCLCSQGDFSPVPKNQGETPGAAHPFHGDRCLAAEALIFPRLFLAPIPRGFSTIFPAWPGPGDRCEAGKGWKLFCKASSPLIFHLTWLMSIPAVASRIGTCSGSGAGASPQKNPYKAAVLSASKLALAGGVCVCVCVEITHCPKIAVWSSTHSPPWSKIPAISAASSLRRFGVGNGGGFWGRGAGPTAPAAPRAFAGRSQTLRASGWVFGEVPEAHGGYLMQKLGLGGGYGMGLGLDLCPQGVGC